MSKKRFVCCFDCSEVLIHLGRAKAVLARDMFGVECCPQHFKRKYIVDQHRLLTNAQYDEIQQVVYGPEYMLTLDAVPGAVECIEAIVKAGHQACIVTSRTSELDVIREWWRKRSLIGLDFFGTGKGVSKGPTLRDLGADTFIDNDRKKLKLIAAEGIPTKLYLLSWCNNAHRHLSGSIHRIGSFLQFRRELVLLGIL